MQRPDIPPGNIRPSLDQVLVAADPPKTLTEGGLVIPDTSEHSEAARGVDFGLGKGTVLAVGPGRRSHKGKRARLVPDVRPGERILYRRFAGTQIVHEGREYRLVQEDDVFCAFDDPEHKLTDEERAQIWANIEDELDLKEDVVGDGGED